MLQVGKLTYTKATVIWGVASLVPLIPFTLPLFQLSLSDSPRAYLIWIPFLAVAWTAWNVTTKPLPPDTALRSRGAGIGVLLSVFIGLVLVFGPEIWPDSFFRYDVGLLCWPIWSLALFWLVLGMPLTKRAVLPLTYMVLGWPPIYEAIIAMLNPALSAIAIRVMSWFTHVFRWMSISRFEDAFNIVNGHQVVALQVTSACSGSDTILAIVVIFPIMLALFQLTLARKILLVAIGALLAFTLNLVRILAIFVALHYFGFRFAMDVLHPILGAVIFVVIIGVLLLHGGKKLTTISTLFKSYLNRSKLSLVTAIVVTVSVTLALAPLYIWGTGSALTPVTMQSSKPSDLTTGLAGKTISSNPEMILISQMGSGAGNTEVLNTNGLNGKHLAQVSVSDSRFTGPTATAIAHLAQPGQTVSIGNVRLLTHSVRRGIPVQTFLITYTDGHGTKGQVLDEVTHVVGVYNFHRMYVTSQWMTDISQYSAVTPKSSVALESRQASWVFVTKLLHNIANSTPAEG